MDNRIFNFYQLVWGSLPHTSTSKYLSEVESRTQGSRPRPRTQKNARGQGQGPRTQAQLLSKKKKKKVFTKTFQAISKKKKKVFTKIFLAISTKKRFLKNFSSAPQNFDNSKNSAVLEPRTGQFSRT